MARATLSPTLSRQTGEGADSRGQSPRYGYSTNQRKKFRYGFSPTLGVARRCSVGFARESCRIETIMDLKYQNTKRSSEKIEIGFSDDLFSATATLFLPPSGGGRLGWGWLADVRHKGQEPPSPQPSPAGRERGRITECRRHYRAGGNEEAGIFYFHLLKRPSEN